MGCWFEDSRLETRTKECISSASWKEVNSLGEMKVILAFDTVSYDWKLQSEPNFYLFRFSLS
jgi:hypothetical protein